MGKSRSVLSRFLVAVAPEARALPAALLELSSAFGICSFCPCVSAFALSWNDYSSLLPHTLSLTHSIVQLRFLVPDAKTLGNHCRR